MDGAAEVDRFARADGGAAVGPSGKSREASGGGARGEGSSSSRCALPDTRPRPPLKTLLRPSGGVPSRYLQH
eukprot:748021-Pyramimonas_sp.AAC.1